MISIVVPVFNEEESIEAFYTELSKEVAKLSHAYEILFVDDGSTDNSLPLLKEIQKNDLKVEVVSFRKNLGKSEALTLGFQLAQGEKIVTLDADLQDKPSEIKKLTDRLSDGYDLVSGWRKNRRDSGKKIIASKLFNAIAGVIWGVHLHDYNCGLKVYTKDAAKSLRIYGGLHRFIPLLVHHQGFWVTEVAIDHDVRKFGKSKYGFSKLWKDMPDMFTMFFLTRYSDRPLHFFGWIGGILSFFGLGILSYLTIIKLFGEKIGQRPLLFFGMILLLSGFQIFFTGFLADLIINLAKRDSKEFPIKYSSIHEA